MSFPAGKRKVKVTREEFAKVLLVWLLWSLSEEQIQQTARASSLEETEDSLKLFGLDLENKGDLDKLLQELFVLNMWSIVFSCEVVFKDVNKRDECLDIFHRLVYEEFLEEKREDFEDWLLAMSVRYAAYLKAWGDEGEPGPLWNLAKVINVNIFGKLNPSAFIQFDICNYITSSIKAVESLIEKYDVK